MLKRYILLFIGLYSTGCFAQNNGKNNLEELRSIDKSLYELLLKIKTEKNSTDIQSIAAYILQKKQNSSIQDFLSQTDSAIFNNIPLAGNAINDTATNYKLYILRSCDTIINVSKSNDYTYLVSNIDRLNQLTKRINEGSGLVVMRKLTNKQKKYFTPFFTKVLDYCEDYYAVSASYNPTLPSIKLREAKLKQLSLNYKKPIQQAYIKQELAKIAL